MKTILRAYKTELDPNDRQRTAFARFAGTSRFVYNWALADRMQRREQGLNTTQYEQRARFNAIKDNECPWIRETPYAITEAAFANLDAAYKHFFRRCKEGAANAGFPKFKNRFQNKSFALTSTRVETDRVRLTHVGWVRLKERDYLPTSASGLRFGTYATISERAGRWYISVLVEEPRIETMTIDDVVGIDLGLKMRAMLSNGEALDTPAALRDNERKLARLQRELARRARGSQNRKKTAAKIARLHAKIAHVRAHWHHQISHHIVSELKPRAIVIEDLNVSGMMSNHHLAKSVANAGFYELRRQLEYKAEWAGIAVVVADRWYPSSKTCSACGHKIESLALGERIFHCPVCGLEIDRDLNAARNLASLAIDRCEPRNTRGLPGELECNEALL